MCMYVCRHMVPFARIYMGSNTGQITLWDQTDFMDEKLFPYNVYIKREMYRLLIDIDAKYKFIY